MSPSTHARPPTTVWRATGHEPPVFLDETGRRRRRMLALSAVGALVAALWLVGIVGGGLGFSGLPAVPGAPAVVPAAAVHSASAHPRRSGASSALSASAALIALQQPAHAVHVVLVHRGDIREDAVERFGSLQPTAAPAAPVIAAAAPLAQRAQHPVAS